MDAHRLRIARACAILSFGFAGLSLCFTMSTLGVQQFSWFSLPYSLGRPPSLRWDRIILALWLASTAAALFLTHFRRWRFYLLFLLAPFVLYGRQIVLLLCWRD